MSSWLSGRPPSLRTMASRLRLLTACSSAVPSRTRLDETGLEPAVSSPSTIHTSLSRSSSSSFSSIMLPIRPYFRNCFVPSWSDESVLNIELMTASSDHHVFMRIAVSCFRDGSDSAHGNGYLESQRLTMPASSAAGMFSWRTMLMVFRAFFSPSGRVFGRIGESVLDVSSTCSSRKWQRQSTRAVYVGRSRSWVQTEVRDTIRCLVSDEEML